MDKATIETTLRNAYMDSHRARFLLARAGVDTAKVNWQAAPRQIWEQTMALVTDAELAKIVTVAVADPSVARYHAKLRAAMA